MLGSLDTAQRTLSTQLDQLRQLDTLHLHSDVIAHGGAKLLQVAFLRDQLVSGAKDVTALRAAVASAVADIRAYTSEARSAVSAVQAGSGEQSADVALTAASEAARAATNNFVRDFYDHHEFDRYLEFASAEDREDYRKREAERRAAIDKAMAEHTPEGDLRANQLAVDQLKDSGAHGATRSPEYAPLLHNLEDKGQDLGAAIPAAQASAAARQRLRVSSEPPVPGSAPADGELADALARFRAQVSLADQHQDGPGSAVSAAGRTPTDPLLPSH